MFILIAPDILFLIKIEFMKRLVLTQHLKIALRMKHRVMLPVRDTLLFINICLIALLHRQLILLTPVLYARSLR